MDFLGFYGILDGFLIYTLGFSGIFYGFFGNFWDLIGFIDKLNLYFPHRIEWIVTDVMDVNENGIDFFFVTGTTVLFRGMQPSIC